MSDAAGRSAPRAPRISVFAAIPRSRACPIARATCGLPTGPALASASHADNAGHREAIRPRRREQECPRKLLTVDAPFDLTIIVDGASSALPLERRALWR